MSELRELIKKLAETEQATIVQGKVKSVDQNKRTCIVTTLISEAEIPDVRLNAVIDTNDKYHVMYPKEKSVVWLAFADNSNEAVVIACSEVTKIETRCDNIVYNKGLNKGLVKIDPLKAELTRLQANITAVAAATLAAISVYSGVLDSGSSAAAFGTAVAALPPQNLSQLENTKIKH